MSLITNDYEAFIFVKDHLLKQNGKAMSDSEDCQYRGYNAETIDIAREEAHNEAIETESADLEDEMNIFYDILHTRDHDAMCAVGCLIIDNFYNYDLEGKTIEEDEIVWEAVAKSNPIWKMTSNSLLMLKALQSIHDGLRVENWETELNNLESQFDKYNNYKQDTE